MTQRISNQMTISDFPSRATAIAALSKIATGQHFRVGGLVFRKVASSSAIPDMPNVEPGSGLIADLAHFVASTSTADRNTGAQKAFEWMNAVDRRGLTCEGEEVYITQTLPAITGLGHFVDWGNATIFNRTTATTGKVFVFGVEGGTTANGCTVEVGRITLQNSPASPNDFLFDLVNATDCKFSLLDGDNLASLVRIGSATHKCSRISFDINGSNAAQGAGTNELILLQNAAVIDAKFHVNGSANFSVNANGAIMRIKPVPGGDVDTVFVFSKSQAFLLDNLDVGGPDGMPFGCAIDTTDGNVTNIFFMPGGFFDHTTDAAILVKDGASSTFFSRAIRVLGQRLATDGGEPIRYEKASGTAGQYAGHIIANNQLFVDDDSPGIRINGTGYLSCIIANNAILGTTPSIAKEAGIVANSDDWTIVDNHIGPNTSATGGGGFLCGVKVENADLREILIEGNMCSTEIVNEFILPTFTHRGENRKIKATREAWLPVAADVADAYIVSRPRKGSQVFVESLAAPSVVTGDGSHFFSGAGVRQWHPTALNAAGVTTRSWDFTASHRLWANAARTIAITDGAGIYTADEIAGLSSNFDQATSGSRPTWTSAATSYALFDGTADQMNVTLAQAQALTLGISFRGSNFTSSGPYLAGDGANWSIRIDTSGRAVTTFGTTLVSSVGSFVDGTDYRLIASINGASSVIYKDNVSAASGAVGANSIANFIIGNRQSAGGINFAGRIYRVALIAGILSTADRGYLDTWLTP